MRIIDPQSAVLTNIEVLAYLTANPPRRPPNPPPNSRNWVPSPDLRDHNTVVREIHNYIHRLAPHVLKYPQYINGEPPQVSSDASAPAVPRAQPETPTPLDDALRELVRRLKPFGLTKGEVVMLVNLGVGLHEGAQGDEEGDGEGEGEGEGEVEGEGEGEVEEGGAVEEMEVDEVVVGGEGAAEEESVELSEEDYGALALLDTVIEEREERLSNEDVARILAIMRETLGNRRSGTGEHAG